MPACLQGLFVLLRRDERIRRISSSISISLNFKTITEFCGMTTTATLPRRTLKGCSLQRQFLKASPPLHLGHPDMLRTRRRRGQGRLHGQGQASVVTVLFLDSQSSKYLLGQWSYFHLENTDSQVGITLIYPHIFTSTNQTNKVKFYCEKL